mmetsp:Transcript_18447/g.45403  ORF Transcript_18447/g.45403 Transcript_18447/m.45403 type:complete len:526 (+) Transcript_18447:440-2017(+)
MHKDFRASGATESLVKVTEESEQTHVRQAALLSVAALAKDPAIGTSVKTLQALILHARSADPILQWYALGGIRNACRHAQGLKQILKLAVVDVLVQSLDLHQNPSAQIQAIGAIGDLSLGDSKMATTVRASLVQCAAYSALCGCLERSESAEVRSKVCRTLQKVVGAPVDRTTPLAKSQIESTGLATTVTQLLRSEAAMAVEGFQTIAVLARFSDALAASFVQVGAARAATRAIGTTDKMIVSSALLALSSLSERDELVPALRQNGVLAALATLNTGKRAELTGLAIECIANFARIDEARTEIAHEGALQKILKSWDGNAEGAIAKACGRALYNLCLGGLSRVMVVQAGGVDTIVALMSSKDEQTRLYAVGAAASLSENFEFAIQVVKQGGVPALVRAANDKGVIGRYGLLALAEMTNLQETHGVLVANGAVEPMLAAAMTPSGRGGHDIEVQQHASLAVCNLACSDSARSVLQSIGGPAKLSALARSALAPPEIANIANVALANLLRREQTLTQVVPFSPMDPI